MTPDFRLPKSDVTTVSEIQSTKVDENTEVVSHTTKQSISTTTLTNINYTTPAVSTSSDEIKSNPKPSLNYQKAYPGLDTLTWLTVTDRGNRKIRNRVSIEASLRIMRKFQMERKRQLFELLLALEPDHFLMIRGAAFFQELRNIGYLKEKKELIYQNQKTIQSLSEIQSDLPACRISTNPTFGEHRLWDFDGLKISEVAYPRDLAKDIQGIRISFDQSDYPGNTKRFNFIECFVKSQEKHAYRNLQVIHLLATLGVDGWYSDHEDSK